MGLEKNGEFVNGKQISIRVTESLYNQMLKDKAENTSLNEVIYRILLNHFEGTNKDFDFEEINVFSRQLAKKIYIDYSQSNNNGLLLESWLQIIRSKILKHIEVLKEGELIENEKNN